MTKEIGSTYYLAPHITDSFPKKSLKSPNILKAHESYVSTCRSAIGLCLDKICVEKKVALLPSFTCESVLSPFLKHGYEIYPYPIGLDLNIYWEQFKPIMDKVKPSVILTHPYFGFNTTEQLRNHIGKLRKDENIIFIEDMTQSMFSGFKPLPTNYHVGSIRKWMPIPDGAFTTAPFYGSEEDTELTDAKLKALKEKGEWIINGKGNKEVFRMSFKIAEGILDSREKTYSMSSVSREIFAHSDVGDLKNKRWMNYRYLLNQVIKDSVLLSNLNVIQSELSSNVCPFHFSVYVKEGRKELQQYLADNDIYATVIWRCPKEFETLINNDAHYIYNHILCFHVDQRYNMDDMKRIIDTLKEYYKK